VISGFHRDVNEVCFIWEFTQHRLVILYRRFGENYRPHLQGPSSPRKLL